MQIVFKQSISTNKLGCIYGVLSECKSISAKLCPSTWHSGEKYKCDKKNKEKC